MQVYASESMIKKIIIIATIAVVVAGGMLLNKYNSTKDYIPVEGTLIYKEHKVGSDFVGTLAGDSEVKKIMHYTYTYNGKEYECSYRLVFNVLSNFKKEGSKKTIFINKDKPYEYRNPHDYNVALLWIFLMSLVDLLMIYALIRSKKKFADDKYGDKSVELNRQGKVANFLIKKYATAYITEDILFINNDEVYELLVSKYKIPDQQARNIIKSVVNNVPVMNELKYYIIKECFIPADSCHREKNISAEDIYKSTELNAIESFEYLAYIRREPKAAMSKLKALQK